MVQNPPKYDDVICEQPLTPNSQSSVGSYFIQIVQVLVQNPSPTKVEKDGSFEDTMLLLELMREKKQKENKMKKEEMIRQMAMEQKLKSQNQAIKLTF